MNPRIGSTRLVTVLCAATPSVYDGMNNCSVWNKARDAAACNERHPVVAHPPCRLWGKCRKLSTADKAEMDLARMCVLKVQKLGGVLEHPAGSLLWRDMSLPLGRAKDKHGGYTFQCSQFHWGHPAAKNTWLYIVGCDRPDLPAIPFRPGEPDALVMRPFDGETGGRRVLSPLERSASPLAFAEWLVEIARRSFADGFFDTHGRKALGKKCRGCGGIFGMRSTGRLPTFCSPGCRLRNWRGSRTEFPTAAGNDSTRGEMLLF